VTSLEHKLEDDIFGDECQTINPKNIQYDIGLVVETIEKQRPSNKDDIFHIVEKEYPYAINLFEYAHSLNSGVPSAA
jgi:hypothetical protein